MPGAPQRFGTPGLWPAALAAVAGSVIVGLMPLITLRLYAEGLSAPSMLVWRYGIALVPLFAVAAMARHNLAAALRGGAWKITLVGATLGAGQTLCFWESLHTLDTSVAIRTCQILGDDVYFQAGGGFVADSEPEAEYAETLDKARGMVAALAP